MDDLLVIIVSRVCLLRHFFLFEKASQMLNQGREVVKNVPLFRSWVHQHPARVGEVFSFLPASENKGLNLIFSLGHVVIRRIRMMLVLQ
jgi:hypothetical protein